MNHLEVYKQGASQNSMCRLPSGKNSGPESQVPKPSVLEGPHTEIVCLVCRQEAEVHQGAQEGDAPRACGFRVPRPLQRRELSAALGHVLQALREQAAPAAPVVPATPAPTQTLKGVSLPSF
ncbi:uncharacterized protein Aud_007426 [Aspergillus udagawae]|uniref:Uncharacterized protein n=1 Tax=Aspergillus udagawae TaxID=91492 RepID=A0A8E0V0Z2_9EURO|nr:uncharacterized protein Aud_007426 [Aspergillus udagawae]GIC90988.1 hypothetical protein Aud_007426 [Aspergillus udagawae]